MLLAVTMALSYWIQGFWLTALGLQALLVIVVTVQKVWRRFPLFTVFVVLDLVIGTIEYSLTHHPKLYLFTYIVGGTVLVGMALAVLYETYVQLFLGHQALRRLSWLAFWSATGLLLALGTVVIYAHTPLGAKGLVAAVMVVEEASRVFEVGLIMFLFIFSTAFGLHWRQQVFGIVLGLGISAAVNLVITTLLPNFSGSAGLLNLALMVSYNLTLLIWLIYLLMPERVTTSVELPHRTQLEQWNRAVTELIHQ